MLQQVFAITAIAALTRGSELRRMAWRRGKFGIVAAALGVVALRARSVWLDTATAVGVTVLAMIFMMANLSVLSA